MIENNRENFYKKHNLTFLLQIVIFISVISQIAELAYIMKPLVYIGWISFIAIALFCNKCQIRKSNYLMLYTLGYCLYFIYCMILSVFGYEHYKSNFLRLMIIPLVVLVAVNTIYTDKVYVSYEKLVGSYIAATLIFAIYIFFKYFRSYGQWQGSDYYLFTQKNSAGQILAVAVILNFFVFHFNRIGKVINLLLYAFDVFFVLLILLSHCRTALLALVFVLVVNCLINKKYRLFCLVVVFSILIIYLRIPDFKDFVDRSIMIGKYAKKDLDSFSSGRITLWSEALEVFLVNPIVGVGNFYVDCLYLQLLAESGVVGFTIIGVLWIVRAVENISCGKINKYGMLIVSLTFFYLIESIFEAYPPFGPGVSSFMFWLSGEYIHESEYNLLFIDTKV